ncbi:transcriptional regulator [Shewanella psychrophila]|uniref:Transcriptional regulator n=1 Tax=Shewanella psychrophila TaxID=225848 RepID=A0A1S6HWE3_9GAMM|nr:LysR family transcriptional regulator [Shewanella psychrophila]AQS39897.1 transcriptional regulator [Shewanella psychrophila]
MSLDLNLLKTLTVLLKVKSVTLTAEHLNTSQPNVSRTLKKLKEHFNDRLIVKGSYGLELTEKAYNLEKKLLPLMNELKSLLNEEKLFVPMKCKEKVVISLNSNIAHWLIPVLSPILSKEAPGMKFIYKDWTKTSKNEIEEGSVHMGLNYSPLELPKHFRQKVCGTEYFVGVCRHDHPKCDTPFTVNDLATYPLAIHEIIDFNDKTLLMDEYYKKFKIKPNIQLRSTHLSLILHSLSQTDMVLPTSMYLSKTLNNDFRVVEIDKSFHERHKEITMISRVKGCNSPMYIWLSNLITDAIKTIEKNTNHSDFVAKISS